MFDAGVNNGDESGGEGSATLPQNSVAVRPEKLRAVIVEDEAIIAIDIEDILTDLGVEVIGSALTAEQAVDLAEAGRPDFVTMDIRLQGDRDGVSAALEIYERFGIRSIFISAFIDPATVARAAQASPLSWLSKPLRRDRLEGVVRNIQPPSGTP